MKVSAQLELILVPREEVIRDGLLCFLCVVEELLVCLVPGDEVRLKSSAEGLVLLMLPTEAFQCWQPQCSHLSLKLFLLKFSPLCDVDLLNEGL